MADGKNHVCAASGQKPDSENPGGGQNSGLPHELVKPLCLPLQGQIVWKILPVAHHPVNKHVSIGIGQSEQTNPRTNEQASRRTTGTFAPFHTHTDTHTHTHTHTHRHTHRHARTHRHTHTDTHARTHLHEDELARERRAAKAEGAVLSRPPQKGLKLRAL